jgi:hypothetical protein
MTKTHEIARCGNCDYYYIFYGQECSFCGVLDPIYVPGEYTNRQVYCLNYFETEDTLRLFGEEQP